MKRIRSDRIILGDRLFDGYLYLDGTKITEVSTKSHPVSEEIDLRGYYVSAGFVDIHTHGGGGNPFEGTVDWEDVAFGMRCCDFRGILDVEVTAWALPGDEKTRLEFSGKALSSAKRLLYLSDQIKF